MSRYTLVDARGRPKAAPPEPPGFDRREALAWFAAGSATLMSGCSGKAPASVRPYVEQPEGLATGEVQRFATTTPLAGYDRGVVGLCRDGRPTKLEGSPLHPASLGATDVFAEAEVLSLYDPNRLRTPETPDGPAAWSDAASALAPRMAAARAKGGEGLTILTGRVTSPTELRLMSELQAALPKMRLRRWEPVDDDAAREGSRLAFGRVLDVRPRLAECAVVLCLDADPLGPGPDQIVNARAFAQARTAGRTPFLRLYVAEAGWSLTGMNADHRLAADPAVVTALAQTVAARLGVGASPAPPSDPGVRRLFNAVSSDLAANRGRAVVIVGRGQPVRLHALAHVINARLDAPTDLIPAVDPQAEDHAAALMGLCGDLDAGRVDTLVVVGSNPAYGAPAMLRLPERLRRAGFLVTASATMDETAELAAWRLPLAHPLESWGDGRAADGTAAVRQPLVRRLHESRSAAELFALLLDGSVDADGRTLTRQTWRALDDDAWMRALSDGVVRERRAPPAAAAPRIVEPLQASKPARLTLILAPDPTLYDGRHAGNAWLQECPKPLTHEVWGASVAISPSDAARLKVATGDHLCITCEGRSVEAPVRVTAGQAPGVLSGLLGGGRRAAGPVGTGVGADLAAIRPADAPWSFSVAAARVVGRGRPPAFSATVTLEGEARKLSPVLSMAGGPRGELDRSLHPASLYPDKPPHSPAWAMVIDTAACVGCNACVVACQAENNVPVVGPHEVARGRDMHWLRIDTYEVDGRPAFQPVPCMQCEHAPCEPVCPVEASVHDHEGLNAQVYNRCIGTRFCQANCPYKVRRFNFHGYAHEQAYADTGAKDYAAQKNPDVTVRARGVMEKCTYCVQRLSAARRTAEKEGRPIREGEAVTACQSACPTRAIHFGDLSAPGSQVAALRRDQRHYVLLGELGTRPRTTYLADLRNPNPALEGGA